MDVTSGENLLAILPGSTTSYSDTISHPSAPKYFYAVSALDKMNNESAPAVQSVLVPEILALQDQFAPKDRFGRIFPATASSVAYFPYELQMESNVSLKIVDVDGRIVLTIVQGGQSRGRYIAAADLSSIKDGMYSCILSVGRFTATQSIRVHH